MNEASQSRVQALFNRVGYISILSFILHSLRLDQINDRFLQRCQNVKGEPMLSGAPLTATATATENWAGLALKLDKC